METPALSFWIGTKDKDGTSKAWVMLVVVFLLIAVAVPTCIWLVSRKTAAQQVEFVNLSGQSVRLAVIRTADGEVHLRDVGSGQRIAVAGVPFDPRRSWSCRVELADGRILTGESGTLAGGDGDFDRAEITVRPDGSIGTHLYVTWNVSLPELKPSLRVGSGPKAMPGAPTSEQGK